MILAPFEWFVSILFRISLSICGNPGLALIGMSFLLSLSLAPFYYWVETIKKRGRIRNAPMQAEIDKIMAVYSGQERFFYIREIQRRYHFNPFQDLVPLLGLLIQIPFLIAAYRYLSVQDVFHGFHFLNFQDLAKPDSLGRIFGKPLNLLPFLMTAVNFWTVFRFEIGGNIRKGTPHFAIAILFLVLLYGCPASVLLYWTFNNVFSLLRNSIFVRAGILSTPPNPPRLTTSTIAPQSILSHIIGGLIALSTCLGVGIIFHLSPESDSRDSLQRMLILSLLVAESVAFWIGNKKTKTQRLLKGVLYVQWIEFASILIGPRMELDWRVEMLVALPLLCLFLFQARKSVFPVWQRFWQCPAWTNTQAFAVSFAAFFYLLFTLCVWHPTLVFLAEPSSFDIEIEDLVRGGVFWGIQGLFLACLLLYILYRIKALRHAALILFSVSVLACLYWFVVPIDLGSLQGSQLTGIGNLVLPASDYCIDFLLILSVVCLSRLAFRKYAPAVVAGFLIILQLVPILQIAAYANSMPPAGPVMAPTPENKIIFSNNHSNILVIVLDMADGWRFKESLDDPEIAAAFDGFTYYPNAVSVSTTTLASMPAIMGGEDFLPDALDQDGAHSLQEKYNAAFQTMTNRIENKGFRFSLLEQHPLFPDSQTPPSPLYDPRFLERISGKPDYFRNFHMDMILRNNALLQGLPLFMKHVACINWEWTFVPKNSSFRPYTTSHRFLESLPRLSKSAPTDQNLYRMVRCLETHVPWGIPDATETIVECSASEAFQWSIVNIANWMIWMQLSGTYDNTRVIIMSDHGNAFGHAGDYNAPESPFIHRERWSELNDGQWINAFLKEGSYHSFNCLMLMKDFGERHPIKTDGRLMGNHSIPLLAESAKIQEVLPNLPSSYKTWAHRCWLPEDAKDPFIRSDRSFEIKTDIFDLENWQRVDPSESCMPQPAPRD